MSIRLSICIPTYNRAAFLGQALDSIIAQATDEVEIVISDNASTDDTEALVRDYQARFPRLRYHRNPENLGADRNFLKVVEIAQGEYGWLLGSDDALAEGAVATVLSRLGRADVYLSDVQKRSFAMDRVIEPHHRMYDVAPDTTWDCSQPNQLFQYFATVAGKPDLFSLFGYISSLIVRRSAWMAQPVIDELIGSCWIHAARIFQMMKAGARLEYLGLPLVLNRCGNDSFQATVGYTRRRLIDLDYPRVARAVFSDEPEVLQQVTLIDARQFFNLRVMLSDKRAAIEADGPQAPQKLAAVYAAEFSHLPGYGVKMMLWRLAPFSLLNGLRALVKQANRLQAMLTKEAH